MSVLACQGIESAPALGTISVRHCGGSPNSLSQEKKKSEILLKKK